MKARLDPLWGSYGFEDAFGTNLGWYQVTWEDAGLLNIVQPIVRLFAEMVFTVSMTMHMLTELIIRYVTAPDAMMKSVETKVATFLEPLYSVFPPQLLYTLALTVSMVWVAMDTHRYGPGTFAKHFMNFVKAGLFGALCVTIIAKPSFLVGAIEGVFNDFYTAVVPTANGQANILAMVAQIINFGDVLPEACQGSWSRGLTQSSIPWPSAQCTSAEPDTAYISSVFTSGIMVYGLISRLLFVFVSALLILFTKFSLVFYCLVVGVVGLLSIMQRHSYSWAATWLAGILAKTVMVICYLAVVVLADSFAGWAVSGAPSIMKGVAAFVIYHIAAVVLFLVHTRIGRIVRERSRRATFSSVSSAMGTTPGSAKDPEEVVSQKARDARTQMNSLTQRVRAKGLKGSEAARKQGAPAGDKGAAPTHTPRPGRAGRPQTRHSPAKSSRPPVQSKTNPKIARAFSRARR